MANTKRAVAPIFNGEDFYIENGTIRTLGGGGGGYPPDNTKGLKLYGSKMGVKVDGETIVFDEDGNIKSEGGYPPDDTKGIELSEDKLAVKVDDETVTFDEDGKLKVINGTGTTDYNVLVNKPKINDVILRGSLYSDDLGLQNVEDSNLETESKYVVGAINEVNAELDDKVDIVSLDGVLRFEFRPDLPAIQEVGVLYFIEEDL